MRQIYHVRYIYVYIYISLNSSRPADASAPAALSYGGDQVISDAPLLRKIYVASIPVNISAATEIIDVEYLRVVYDVSVDMRDVF